MKSDVKPSTDSETGTDRRAFRRALLAWFDGHRRDLPWRGVDDPYAVWVSEVMLQQTQVATVVDYFEGWMKRFPTVEDLADAPVDEVLELWSGLGYYRRARYLHRAAQKIVAEYGGQIPDGVEALRELPGIGPYTAGAIASIAFGQAEPVVDGNVMRVVTRLEGIEGDPRRAPAKGKIWERAETWVDRRRPGDFNQGLMELGSEVCTPSSPGCDECPLAQWCQAYEDGDPERYPTGKRRTEQRPMRGRCCVVYCERDDGTRRFLLRRRPDTGLLAGLWEFPSCEQKGERWPATDALRRRLTSLIGGDLEVGAKMGAVEHVFSHRRLKMRVHELELGRECEVDQGWRWVSAEELTEVASAALLRKIHELWRAQR